jgi:hypothetical protein
MVQKQLGKKFDSLIALAQKVRKESEKIFFY